MIVFATSDKGGTGRSVTSGNVAYRAALRGDNIAYLDFDFGSPTAGAIFDIPSVEHGTIQGGLHSHLRGELTNPTRLDVWSESDRSSLRGRPAGAGRLVLLPGDSSGGEFNATPDMVRRAIDLMLSTEEEFDVTIVDLSAGRSYATDIALAASAYLQKRGVVTRWLVFHRWTRQHIIAAASLVYGDHGLLKTGAERGHDPQRLADSIRFVRTAVVDPDSPALAGLGAPQVAWLRECNANLQVLAQRNKVGRTLMLGAVPLDPVLQWREQLISNNDVYTRQIANLQTVEAFEMLAEKLTDDRAWEGL
ncbi:SCO2523 family variant P-loop protein [Rugosimonospora africana]|uniref:DNA-binding protein n=1 Tax=Rugosimonospora africana TaxID=556532 RepID=A0A8J3QK62_9ACTN|nr:SCO2523 family variant P-loop protein [Rugosimonospora africana]GIH12091.1 DNA-binding protein [Rugosimonospora africana]